MLIRNDQIANVLSETQTSEEFATYAACRERNAKNGITSISTVKAQMATEGFRPITSDLIDMFKGLEKIGVGKLQGNQFKWNMPIKKVGQVVGSKDKHQEVVESKPTALIPLSTKTLLVCLEGNKEIEVKFTPNLSRREVELVMERVLYECSN